MPTHSFLRKLTTTAAAAAIALGVSAFVVAPSASAAGGRTGTRIDSMPMTRDSSKIGRVELWYISAKGWDGQCDKHDMDYYGYYAGPVKLTTMAEKCVSWGGKVYVDDAAGFQAFRYNTHCG